MSGKLWDRDEVRIALGRVPAGDARMQLAREIIDDLIGAANEARNEATAQAETIRLAADRLYDVIGPERPDLPTAAAWVKETVRKQGEQLAELARLHPDRTTWQLRIPTDGALYDVHVMERDEDLALVHLLDDDAQHPLRVPTAWLVAVRPPSINDPSKWPLTIEQSPGHVLRLGTDAIGGCAVISIAYGSGLAALSLTEDDLWELAKSAAQYVMGRRRFDEIQAAGKPAAPSTVDVPPGQVRYACDRTGCTVHIAGPDDAETLAAIQEHEDEHRADDERDGPFPFPGDDVAERLPDGGWRVRLPMLDSALRERRLPKVAPAEAQSCGVEISDGSPNTWYCAQFHVAEAVWHIATMHGMAVAVWRANPARRRADRDQADHGTAP